MRIYKECAVFATALIDVRSVWTRARVSVRLNIVPPAIPTLILCMPLAALTIPAAAFADELTPGSGAVHVQQVDFRNAPNSTTGALTIDVSAAVSATGYGSGYINASDASGRWVVQNVCIIDPYFSGYEKICCRFDLRGVRSDIILQNGDDIDFGFLHVEYTPYSLTGLFGTATTLHSIGASKENFGGLRRPGVPASLGAYRAPPPAVEPNAPAADPNGVDYEVLQPGHPNVEAAKNQCFPAAVANSLQWLEDTNPIDIRQDHVPGLRKDVDPNDPNSLVGEIERHMDRPVQDRYHGDGVYDYEGLVGKLTYIDREGLADQIMTKHQGLFISDPNDPNTPDWIDGNQDLRRGSATSHGHGPTPTFDWILSELEHGEDVEVLLVYVNPFWDPNDPNDPNNPRFLGGHAVELVGAGTARGKPYIRHISDERQSDPNHPEWDDSNDPCIRGTGWVTHDTFELDPNNVPAAAFPYYPDFPYIAGSQAIITGVISESYVDPNECLGDIGGAGGCGVSDGAVDLTDLGCMLSDYGIPSTSGVGDIGGASGCGASDGNTDLTDLGCLLGAYGSCP